MTDFDTSDPPRYRFGLFGHRASGKSVYLLALGASRRPETDGVNAEFLRPLAPEVSADPANARSVEEIEREYAEALAGLKQGKLPSQTDTIHGNLRYAFSLLNPVESGAKERGAAVRHIEISDHAGELVNRLTSEAEKAAALRSFLAGRDGLVLVAEAPRPGDGPVQRTKALADVTELSARLSQVLEDQRLESLRCRTVVLLVTKWDRIHPFDGFQREDESTSDFVERLTREETRHATLFKQWLETSEAGEHLRLLNDLRTRFGAEAVRAYPVTAFGEASRRPDRVTGELVEVPTRLPLATLNLVKPLRFLVERTDQVYRSVLMRTVAQYDPGGALQFWRLRELSKSRRSDFPKWHDIRPRFGSDPELQGVVERLHRRRRKVRALQSCVGGIALVLAAFGAAFSHGVVIASQQRGAAEAALATPALESLIAADVALASRREATLLRPSRLSQRWLLPDSGLESLRSRLMEAECDRWHATINIQSGISDPQQTAAFVDRIRDAPRCQDLSEAIAQYEASRRSTEILTQIDERLNAYEFVPAIEQIFAATSDPIIQTDNLRARLQGIDGRFAGWAVQMESRPYGDEIILRGLIEVLGALTSPPRELTGDVSSLRELLVARRETLKLQIACTGFQELLQEARYLSETSGGWPRLDSIDALLASIGQWSASELSVFRNATLELRDHVLNLKKLHIRGVSTSGALDESLRDSDAKLTITIGATEWSAIIDSRRAGQQRLEASVKSGPSLLVDLAENPQFQVRLEERRWRRSRNWLGRSDSSGPSTWNVMRDMEWSVEFDISREDAPNTRGRIRVTVLLATPPSLPTTLVLPTSCNQ